MVSFQQCDQDAQPYRWLRDGHDAPPLPVRARVPRQQSFCLRLLFPWSGSLHAAVLRVDTPVRRGLHLSRGLTSPAHPRGCPSSLAQTWRPGPALVMQQDRSDYLRQAAQCAEEALATALEVQVEQHLNVQPGPGNLILCLYIWEKPIEEEALIGDMKRL